ncbi:hypothetical protein DUNSADRAFT_6146 [Dunaliella salina]|uniref:Uncharacterized protein n=1 Tax=Dunaliella salina TaxID=3046 RepID=A0ABQ7GNY8_DUNSA|nr:hypothetical protein DUNSADRAFT_6146 [Dunaliella salina]|eukprot:KAF5836316.1 hypothetical protein DUNSADRAFT_6146 [Dunaliella salina]
MPQLLLLAVLVCCSILCKPLLAIEECPCWELNPDPATGECIDGYLPLVYSSREFLETYTQCVDRVTYDADYGALVASLCWNKDCLPERFQDQTVLVELNLGEEELADMTEGNYTSTFKGEPSQNGIRLRTSVSAFEQFEQGVERVSVRGDNATFTVPEGGLTRLKIEWEWPNQLNAPEAGSNQAFVIIRNSSLSEVPLTWPGLQSLVDAHSLSNLDLCEPVQAVGEDTEGASCDKGKVALRVMRTPDFEGVSEEVIEFEEEDVAALMCVDPPKYDKYTQLLEWGFAWDYDCWEPAPEYTEATVFRMEEVPSVEGSERNGLDGLGIPSNAQIQLMTRAEQIYATVGEGEDSKQAMVPYFSVRKVNEPHFDGLGGFESETVPSCGELVLLEGFRRCVI